ncbi:hypothetical protein HPB51_024924 [Rhipicephalus microplus]|uniref:Uncharacterized protein n=1 Tax=Rhipicephalus microplus TaxID=6941 RepID=A0A9J6F901_RHIMP|nr:hypothetical protein HPB51_024924 [Rhipicephalus microplus]
MIVHHAGCSRERIDPESASVGYSVRYTGIAVCSVLGVATVVLSLFLFTKLVLKPNRLSACTDLMSRRLRTTLAARRRTRPVERAGTSKENATSRKTTKSLDDLIRSFFSHTPTDGDDRVSRPTRRSYNDSAYKPNLEGGPGAGDGNDDVQIPYVPPQPESTEPPKTTTPSALVLEGGTQPSSYGRKSHLEDILPRSDRVSSGEDDGGGRPDDEGSGSESALGET